MLSTNCPMPYRNLVRKERREAGAAVLGIRSATRSATSAIRPPNSQLASARMLAEAWAVPRQGKTQKMAAANISMTGPRPDFIWTPRQPVSAQGYRAVYLGEPRRSDGQNRWFLFRRALALPAAPSKADISIAVDGRYRLFANGKAIGRGPVRASPLFLRYDTHDVASALH